MYFRYVVNIDTAANKFKKRIMEILGFSDYIPVEYIDQANYLYTESIMQMVLVMDNHLDDYMLKLIDAPDIRFFEHIKQLNPELCDITEHKFIADNIVKFTGAFKEAALDLIMIIQHTINKENSEVEYLLESITGNNIIIIKKFKGQPWQL